MVHLCEWINLSQVSSGGHNGKDKTRKTIKITIKIKEEEKSNKRRKERNEGGER